MLKLMPVRRQKTRCGMSNSTWTKFSEWRVRQSVLNGVFDSKSWMKVRMPQLMLYVTLCIPCDMARYAGSYNKVFNLDFDNGMEVIVRIPCPLAGPPFLTTASEVATLDFVRSVLGIPAPRVFAWNADARTNSVGAEYMILEKVLGVPSQQRWAHIAKGPQVFPLLYGVFDIERKFELAPFSQIGSLYFRDDVPADLQKRPLFYDDDGSFSENGDNGLLKRLDAAKEKYRVGPIIDRQWWRGARSQTIYDHGPCQ
jgi:hypothetical protein